MMHVLKTGYHEKRKTSFDPVFKRWKYAIRGVTHGAVVKWEKEDLKSA
jgi:hypothetical protein